MEFNLCTFIISFFRKEVILEKICWKAVASWNQRRGKKRTEGMDVFRIVHHGVNGLGESYVEVQFCG